MYNCLRFCRRLASPFTLEAVDQVIRKNGRIFSNEGSLSRYHNNASSLFNNSAIVMKERKLPEKVSNYNELVSHINHLPRIPVEQLSKLFTTIKDDNLTEKQVITLLECCSKSIPSDNITTKHNLCQTVLSKYLSAGKFSEKVYESYIYICTENKQCLDVKSLISSLGSNITQNLMKLLLRNVCEFGDDVKALQVLSEMKTRGYAIDEEVFNYLILAHTIQGGLSSGLKIVQTMNMAKIQESSDSFFFLIKGLAQRDDLKDFKDALERYKISYSEYMILSLLDALGFRGNHMWAKLLTKYVDMSLFSRHFEMEVKKLCTNLAHNGKYDAAFEIYKVFVTVELNGTYGNYLLTGMLLSSAPVQKIVEIAKELKESGVNEYALETVTGTALENKLFKPALYFFKHLDILKPHYFWPLLVEAHSENGESGILDIVQTAQDMNVKFDFDSFNLYIFPKCNIRNPMRVINVFQDMGYTVRELLTPMIVALLKRKNFRLANELSETYKEVKINPDDIMHSLSLTWLSTTDHKECITLLQRISESHSDDCIGTFLIDSLRKMRTTSRLRNFVDLLRELKKRNMMINSSSADTITGIINKDSQSQEIIVEIEEALNDIIDFSKIPKVQDFLHPRDMSIEQLETHLIELKSKGMETRGVLRKLIQKYVGQGQRERVKELREELSARGYSSSPGLKSAIMHSHVQEGDLEEAMDIFEDLIQMTPTFKMDRFKIIDLARLLVKNDQFDRAMEILKMSSVQRGAMESSKYCERNCHSLLRSVLDMDSQKKMFNFLIENGYCQPTNVILGTLVQLHLEKDTLENTVDIFVDFTKKYSKTPMQVVLLAEVLEAGKDDILQKVLDGITSVHGQTAARSALLAAMCEKGFVKQVVTILQDSKIYPSKDIEKRCERWLLTHNMKALQTLLAASKELPVKLLNIPKIQLYIMQLYSKQNDCDGALAFWKSLVDEEDHVDTEVDNEFCELLSRCKFSSPENLAMKYKIK